MKIISVAEEDTNVLLGLLGIEGRVIKTQNPLEFKKEFEKILEDESIGIILLNEKYLIRYSEYFKIKKLQKTPIIVEIPDIKAPVDENYFEELITKYIGISI